MKPRWEMSNSFIAKSVNIKPISMRRYLLYHQLTMKLLNPLKKLLPRNVPLLNRLQIFLVYHNRILQKLSFLWQVF